MNTQSSTTDDSGRDPIVDEVRAIRSEICREYGHDVDRLCDHLSEIERQYDSRTGPFAESSSKSAETVIENWDEAVGRAGDPPSKDVSPARSDTQ